MHPLFTREVTVLNRSLTSDAAGGESVSYVESAILWRIRITHLDSQYKVDMPGREYSQKVRIAGEVREDLNPGDRINIDGVIYELISVFKMDGAGSLSDYLRVDAVHVETVEE